MRHGMTREALLTESGIAAESLENALIEVEASQELRVIRNLQEGCSHVPGIGLEVGLQCHATAFDELGYAFISGETLRDTFNLALRFRSLLFFFVEMSTVRSGDRFKLRFDDSGVPADVRQFLLERDMTATCMILRDIFPSNPPPLLEVNLTCASPPYAEQFECIAGIAPRFEQEENSVAMPASFLDARPTQANSVTVRMCVALCEMRLEQRNTRPGTATRVRAHLFASGGAFADMEQIATELDMTSRTLRRHLQEEGTSFRTVLDEVREVMADELFSRTDMTVEEVADRLGFSESSSFISAFKRWKGVSPRKFHRVGRLSGRREQG